MSKIIILETTSNRLIRYVMWADVPTARQKFYADPNFVSAWIDAPTVDSVNVSNLRSGALVERVAEERIDGSAALIRTTLEARLAAYQAEIAARNNWSKYGTTFDGTTWTVGGAA